MEKGLTFDDIMMVPAHTEVASRSECSTETSILGRTLAHPVVPANMDTITESEMLTTLLNSGGIAFPHRFMPTVDQFKLVESVVVHDYEYSLTSDDPPFIPYTIGVKEDLDNTFRTIQKPIVRHYGDDRREIRYINLVLLDVAHADSKFVVERIKKIREVYTGPLVVGNVATFDAVLRMIDAGASGVKVGIGNGSICSTRLVTGHGVPQVTAIQNAVKARRERGIDYGDFAIVSDGGCNHYGDVVKALGLGANLVMSGRLFAGCTETPGDIINNSQGIPSKIYRGMASSEAQSERQFNTKTAEGVSHVVPIKGSASGIIRDVMGAIRSGLSYSGVRTIDGLFREAEFITQTANGLNESLTRR